MNTMALDYPTAATYTINKVKTEDFSDEMLMRALCDHRTEWALEKLYERYKRYAYSLAYHILGDSFLAEDIVQEVFFTLWHKAPTYQESQGSVKSWLKAVVRNRAIDKVRASTQHDYQCAPLEDVNGESIASAEPDVWEQVWESEQSSFIHKALRQLPLEQSQIIELSYFHGYTHSEIARQQQIPLGTVKGRVRLGLQKIKLLLSEF
jgi:RNA polymerase sigma-70 factor (ECF subfamily)